MTSYSDRSRYEQYNRCPRSEFLGYEMHGQGISGKTINVPIVIGLGVDAGVSALLLNKDILQVGAGISELLVDKAVEIAHKQFDHDVKGSIYDAEDVALGGEKAIAFKYHESKAIVEALVRVWALLGLPRLLEDYEVIEVQREHLVALPDVPDTMHMLRLDSLLRDKRQGDPYIFNLKTTRTWDRRKAANHKYDTQGLSDLWSTDQITATTLQQDIVGETIKGDSNSLFSQPKVMGSVYHYLLVGTWQKGQQFADQEAADGESDPKPEPFAWPWMRTDLVHPYVRRLDTGLTREVDVRDKLLQPACLEPHPWKVKGGMCPGGKRHYISSKDDYVRGNIWDEHGWSVKRWIQVLSEREDMPLEKFLIVPEPIMRDQQQVEDWLEQYQEWNLMQAEHRHYLRSTEMTEAKFRKFLNIHYPQHFHSCNYPSRCQFVPICHEHLRDPINSGLYKLRVAHRDAEKEALAQ